MASSVTIYGLVDPTDGQIRYVGKTRHPRQRLLQHLREWSWARRRPRPLHSWIRKRCLSGEEPFLIVLERCPQDGWQDRERHHIAKLRGQGCQLVNVADGGDDIPCSKAVRQRNGAKVAQNRPLWPLLRYLGSHAHFLDQRGDAWGASLMRRYQDLIRASAGEQRERFKAFSMKQFGGAHE